MSEFFLWFTRMENTKPFALVIFFVTFVLIILYVFSNKKRSERFESYKHIPLQDDEQKNSRKVNEDE